MDRLKDSPLALSNLASAIMQKEKSETALVSPLVYVTGFTPGAGEPGDGDGDDDDGGSRQMREQPPIREPQQEVRGRSAS
jgi:hypothetical protein